VTVALRASLEARGIRLALVDGRVRVTAAAGALTDADRAALTAQRDALIALLQREAEAPGEDDWLTGAAAAVAITRTLATRGGIVVRSRALNGQAIMFVRDNHVAVPEKYRDLPRFSRADLDHLVRHAPWSVDELRGLVDAKAVFPDANLVDDDPHRERDEARWRHQYGVLPPDFHRLVPAREWFAGATERRP
jgi:hypothetical protein